MYLSSGCNAGVTLGDGGRIRTIGGRLTYILTESNRNVTDEKYLKFVDVADDGQRGLSQKEMGQEP
mgnify:CR=1 FL=1|jgi:hypothetical protein